MDKQLPALHGCSYSRVIKLGQYKVKLGNQLGYKVVVKKLAS
jgi:hypothetical protein